MSFSKTISTIAALTTIFLAGATGYKLAQDNQQPNAYEERIKQLEEQLKQSQQPVLTAPQPTALPSPQPQVTPAPPVLVPPPPVPEEQ